MPLPYFAPPPSTRIQFDAAKSVERPIEGIFPHRSIPWYSCRSKIIFEFASSHLNFVVGGASFVMPSDDSSIYLFDLYRGNGGKLAPQGAFEIARIWMCIGLSDTRAFLIYETKSGSKHGAVIVVDSGAYKLVGITYDLTFTGIDCFYQISCVEPLILVNVCGEQEMSGNRLHLFKFDSSFGVKSHTINSVPQESCLFYLIDGILVYTQSLRNNAQTIGLANFKQIKEEELHFEIADTAVLIDLQRTEFQSTRFGTRSIDWKWHKRQAFVFINLIRVKQLERLYLDIQHSTPMMLTFEWDKKRWTEIQMRLPPTDYVCYDFSVDEDALLTVIGYAKIATNCEETFLCSSALRIPLAKPDKLQNLCWFRVRDCGHKNCQLKTKTNKCVSNEH